MSSRIDYSVLMNGHWLDLRMTSDYNEDEHTMRRRVTDWVGGGSKGLKLCYELSGKEIYVRPSAIVAVRFP